LLTKIQQNGDQPTGQYIDSHRHATTWPTAITAKRSIDKGDKQTGDFGHPEKDQQKQP